MTLKDPQNVDPKLLSQLWRVSPAATAATLSREDPEPWIPFRHVVLISTAIQKAVMGTGPRFLIINTPPQHGKSKTCSQWAPVWFLENFPHKKVMVLGYGTGFASEWGGLVRNTCSQHADKLSFKLAEDSQAKDSWKTDKGGAMYSAGVGGQTTGKGCHLMIIDDPIKNRDEAESLTHRERVWGWWQTTASTRLAKGGVVVVVQTRWHEDDLSGRLLNPQYNAYSHLWHSIVLPAVCDSDNDPLGRAKGEPLCPELHPLDKLEMHKATMGDNWWAMYQQKPRGTDGRGNVYDKFSLKENVMRLDRNPNSTLCWALDFNRDPMCSVIAQYREELTPLSHLTNEKLTFIEALQELWLPDCGTESACHAFIAASKKYVNMARGRVRLEIYGDTSGNKRSTSADQTDWQIVKLFFRRYPEYDVKYFIGTHNPPVKSRVNSVNQALCSADGYRRFRIDPACSELIKDCANVRWAIDGNGNTPQTEIDKRDKRRTHMSDAIGYLIWEKLGFKVRGGSRDQLMQ